MFTPRFFSHLFTRGVIFFAIAWVAMHNGDRIMHETFAEFLERKTTGNCTYKEFARLAVADDTFWDEPEIPHLIYSILHWECSKKDIDRYMTDCVRAWVHWVDSERRFKEWKEYRQKVAQAV